MPSEAGVERSGSSSMEDEQKTKAEKSTPEPKSPAPPTAPQKPSTLKRIWAKTGLDPITLILMTKGALPPVIVMAAYQSDAWAVKYSVLGYLAAIFSFLSLPILPRAKFIQSATLSVLAICIGCALALLEIRCVTSARTLTTSAAPPKSTTGGASGSPETPYYNSSASVVAAVFMFAQIYAANTLRAKRPQLLLPSIQVCIVVIVSSTNCIHFPNMAAGISFIKRFLETTLTGVGIAAGVSFFIFPITSRAVAEKQMAGMLGLMKASLMAHTTYLNALLHDAKSVDGNEDLMSSEAKGLKGIRNKMADLYGKIGLELTFARKEIAYGNLHAHHYDEILVYMREIVLPIMGMTTFIDVVQSVKERYKTASGVVDSPQALKSIRQLKTAELDAVMSMSREEAARMKGFLCQGLTHVGYQLKLAPKPKVPTGDVEKSADAPSLPGEANFTDTLEKEIEVFRKHRDTALQRWCTEKGIELPAAFWDDPTKHYSLKDLQDMTETVKQKESQQQLYLFLYVEYLLWSMGVAILKFSRWADSKVADGTMTKKKLIVPGWKKILRLFQSGFSKEDSGDLYFDGAAGSQIYLGDAFKTKKNPEHLAPSNIYEKSTDFLRVIPAHFRSSEAAFGFRAAVAVISLGVMAFISQTTVFFQEQRVLWALIMVAISMSPTTGQGISGFLARIFGTAVSTVMSMAIWYMADQKTGAIIPLFGILIAAPGIYILLKFPKFAIVGILFVVTSILIVGYELQERKIGLKIATSNHQPYYKIYILAPYRLATVIAGLTVCFIWTYFPYPITTHSTLRKDMGATLYLLANFYSCVHSTVELRLRKDLEDYANDPHSPMHKLDKARNKVFRKSLNMLNRLREHSEFLKFDPNFGGAFPKEKYDKLIHSLQNMLNYMSMMAYSSATFVPTSPSGRGTGTGDSASQWLADFRHFTSDLSLTSHDVTSAMCLLSASLSNAQPLPPYLNPPPAYDLADKMQSIDPELLSVRHVSEPCYAAFAVLEVASSLVTEELSRVVKGVRDLVGEVDFSFHIVSTGASNTSSSGSEATTLAGVDSGTRNGGAGVNLRGKGKSE